MRGLQGCMWGPAWRMLLGKDSDWHIAKAYYIQAWRDRLVVLSTPYEWAEIRWGPFMEARVLALDGHLLFPNKYKITIRGNHKRRSWISMLLQRSRSFYNRTIPFGHHVWVQFHCHAMRLPPLYGKHAVHRGQAVKRSLNALANDSFRLHMV